MSNNEDQGDLPRSRRTQKFRTKIPPLRIDAPMKYPLVLLLTLALALTGNAKSPKPSLPAEVLRAMETSTSFDLLSLHPDESAAHWFNTKFQGYRVLGRIAVTRPEDRRQIIQSVRRGISDFHGFDNKCAIRPRHGLHVVSGTTTYDFLICYECEKIEVVSGERSVFSGRITSDSSILSGFLQAAKIRIAE